MTDGYLLSPSQRAIFAKELAAPGTDINNLYFLLKLSGRPDAPRMERAVNGFVRDNEAARTRVAASGGVPRQTFAPYEPFALPVWDMTAAGDEEILALLDAEGQKPFAQDAPLFDFAFVLLPRGACGLYCKFHHIWTDGWGCGLIWTDILTRYKSDGKERTATVPLSATPGFGEEYAPDAGDAAFWRAYLADLSAPEFAPSARCEAGRLERALPPALCAAVASFAAREKVRPYVVFLTALALYEQGACGGEALVGTARLCRDTEAERAAVGMFVAEIPVRPRIAAGTGFADACRAAERSLADAAAHKKYPLGNILADLRRDQGTEYNPVQYSLSYQKTRVRAGGESPEIIFGKPSHSDSRLVMHVVDYGGTGAYKLYYDYQREFFSEQTAGYLADAIEHILRAGTGGGFKAGLTEVTGDAERAELARLGRGAQLNVDRLFPAMWRELAAQDPDAVAVVDAAGEVSRGKIDAKASAVARALVDGGAQKGDVAAILLPRGARLVAATLGALKAGCAFVWLDETFPDARLEYILNDSGASALITDEAGGRRLTGAAGCRKLFYETLADGATDMEVPVTADDAAYLIYTSGTTGLPKGAVLTHGGLANFCAAGSSAFVSALARCERSLCMGSVSFDISVSEVFPALANGLTVCFADEETRRDPLALAAFMLRSGADAVQSTPSRLLALLDCEDFRRALANVKLVLSAGEDFPPALYARLREVDPACEVFNGYGPTETTVGAAYFRVTGGDVALGEAVANTTLSVRDAGLRLLPFGCAGELCIGGAGVGRGYLNRPDLTSEKFVTVGGERLYRTGDVAVRKPDGALVFLGRKDNQIKLRGQRVEIGEIDARILECAGVTECATILKKQGGARFLCSFCRGAAGEEAVFAHLQKTLPAYMIPAAIVFVDELPKTPAGKTDLRALADMRVERKLAYVPPANASERTLCDIMAKTLGAEKVGAEDSFFDLGGDSLSAATFVLDAAASGFTFAYADVFRTPTVRGLLSSQTPAAAAGGDYADASALSLAWPDSPVRAKGRETVLLTGATGYLGLHVLREYIENTDDVLVCLVRPGKTPSEKRLRNLLYYYFENNYAELFGKRILVKAGDLTSDEIFTEPFDGKIDVAINCAADVSHYTHGNGMKNLNVGGVSRLVAFCRARGAALAQISTVSVVQFARSPETAARGASETDLYFGQDFRNEYIESKFLAEREVLRARAEGLEACVLRVGNLQGRASDGEFQINGKTNAFASSIKADVRLGAAPAARFADTADVSPVDDTARAIRLLLKHAPLRPVCHVFNDKPVAYADIYASLSDCGYAVEKLGDEDYKRLLADILADENKRGVLADIIPQINADAENIFPVPVSCARTAALLRSLGFRWSEIGGEYLQKVFGALKGLGYFE